MDLNEQNEQKGPEILDEYPQGTILPPLMIGGDVDVESLSDDQNICVKHPLGYFKMGREYHASLNGNVDQELTYVAADGRMFYLRDGLYGEDGVREWMGQIEAYRKNPSSLLSVFGALLLLEKEGRFVSLDEFLDLCSGYKNRSLLRPTTTFRKLVEITSLDTFAYTLDVVGDSLSLRKNPDFGYVDGAVPSLRACVDEEFENLSSNDVFAGNIESFSKGVGVIVDELNASAPRNSFEIGEICHRVDELIVDCYGEDSEVLFELLSDFRLRMRNLIASVQRTRKLWQKMDWSLGEEVKRSNVIKVVFAYLGLTGNVEEDSEKLLALRSGDIVSFGIEKAYRIKGGSNSPWDLLADVFGDMYGIKAELLAKKQEKLYRWRTKEETKDNVVQALRDNCGIRSIPPASKSPFNYMRNAILQIKDVDLIRLQLSGAFINNSFYDSFLDLLADIYGEGYLITEELLARKSNREFNWETREKTLMNVENRLSERIGVSKTVDMGSEEFERNRDLILGLMYGDLVVLGLAGAFTCNSFYDSFLDVLADIYGDFYGVRVELQNKKNPVNYKTSSYQKVLEAVGNILISGLGLNSYSLDLAREKILSLEYEDMVGFGLVDAFADNRHFDDYYDLLIAVLGDKYGVRAELEDKRKDAYTVNWSQLSYEETVSRVKRIIVERKGLPLIVPPVGTKEFVSAREKVNSIFQKDFYEWGLRGSFYRSKYFSTYPEVMIALFGEEYDVCDEFESRKGVNKRTWDTKKRTDANVLEVLSENRNIPKTPPVKYSEKWYEVRARIIDIEQSDMLDLVLQGSFRFNDFYNSYIEVLIALFDEDYEIAEELSSRVNIRQFDWSTREKALNSFRRGVSEFYCSTEMLSPIGVDGRFEWFLKIISVDSKFLNAAKMSGAVNLKWFSSYRELAVEAFPELDLKEWYFTNFGRSLFNIVANSEDSTDLISEYDSQLIKGVLEGDSSGVNKFREYLFSLPANWGRRGSVESQKILAFENVLQTIDLIGMDCPVSLKVLWVKAAAYVRTTLFYEEFSYGCRHGEYSDDYFCKSPVEFGDDSFDDDEALTLKQISEKLGPDQQALYQRLMDGELDFDDPEAVKLITAIQADLVG